VRTNIVPVIIAALGTIKNGLDQNLQLFPVHLSAVELQKITLLSRRSGWQNLPLISREQNFNEKYLMSGTKSITFTDMSYSMQIPRTHPLTLGDGMNFLPLTEPDRTDNLR